MPASATDNRHAPEEGVLTSVFQMGGGAMARFLIGHHGFLPLATAGGAALLMLAFGLAFDLRVAIAALMVVCLLLPMLAAWIYFRHGLTFENSVNSLPHTVEITPAGIRIAIYARAIPDENITEKAAEKGHPHPEEPDTPAPRMFFYPPENIATYSAGASALRIPLRSKPDSTGFLLLPYSVFTDTEEFKRAVKILQSFKNQA